MLALEQLIPMVGQRLRVGEARLDAQPLSGLQESVQYPEGSPNSQRTLLVDLV